MACKVVSESMACNTGVVANKTKKLRTDIQETVQEHQEQVGNLTSACTAKSCGFSNTIYYASICMCAP